LTKVDFIKIDVEGFERIVLSGGEDLLSRIISPSILFEFSDFMEGNIENLQAGDTQDFLKKIGYSLHITSDKKNTLLKETIDKGHMMILAEK